MKGKYVILVLCIFFIAVIQSTVLDYVKIYNVKPNLLVIFIISYALLNGNMAGAAVGFVAGMCQDIIAGKMLGFYSLLGMYLGLIVGSLNRRLYRENVLVAVFFTLVSTFAYESAVYLAYEWGAYFLNELPKNRIDVLFALRNIILPEAAYNSLVSIFLYALVIKLNRKFENSGKALRKY